MYLELMDAPDVKEEDKNETTDLLMKQIADLQGALNLSNVSNKRFREEARNKPKKRRSITRAVTYADTTLGNGGLTSIETQTLMNKRVAEQKEEKAKKLAYQAAKLKREQGKHFERIRLIPFVLEKLGGDAFSEQVLRDQQRSLTIEELTCLIICKNGKIDGKKSKKADLLDLVVQLYCPSNNSNDGNDGNDGTSSTSDNSDEVIMGPSSIPCSEDLTPGLSKSEWQNQTVDFLRKNELPFPLPPNTAPPAWLLNIHYEFELKMCIVDYFRKGALSAPCREYFEMLGFSVRTSSNVEQHGTSCGVVAAMACSAVAKSVESRHDDYWHSGLNTDAAIQKKHIAECNKHDLNRKPAMNTEYTSETQIRRIINIVWPCEIDSPSSLLKPKIVAKNELLYYVVKDLHSLASGVADANDFANPKCMISNSTNNDETGSHWFLVTYNITRRSTTQVAMRA
jgi:hypothetical protein